MQNGFILLGIDVKAYIHRSDAESKFYNAKLSGKVEGNRFSAVTPNGEILHSSRNPGETASEGLKKWNQQGRPVKLDSYGTFTASEDLFRPPAGALVLKGYYRALGLDAEGRPFVQEKFVVPQSGGHTIVDPQPQRDYFWFKEAEARAFIPPAAKGQPPRRSDGPDSSPLVHLRLAFRFSIGNRRLLRRQAEVKPNSSKSCTIG